jgi:hypothetical protein
MKMKATKAPKVCDGCKYAPTGLNKLVQLTSGKWVHKSHISDPSSKFYNAK